MTDATGGQDDAALAQFRLDHSASHLLRRAHVRAEGLFADRLAPYELTPRQKAVLISVHQAPGATLSEIAERVVLDRQTTADIAGRLRRRGLVERRRSDRDARAWAMSDTPAGVELLRTVLSLDALVENDILDVLPEEYRPLFLKCLQLMAGARGPGRTG